VPRFTGIACIGTSAVAPVFGNRQRPMQLIRCGSRSSVPFEQPDFDVDGRFQQAPLDRTCLCLFCGYRRIGKDVGSVF